ncbi:hypothetical protein [Rhizobium sp. 18055]|nr:hypothetical protein [Rhizobium sp. 18055]
MHRRTGFPSQIAPLDCRGLSTRHICLRAPDDPAKVGGLVG